MTNVTYQLGLQSSLVEINQRRWRCTHCKRSWVRVSQATRHVGNGCTKDPATRACRTCKHFGGPGECAIGALPYGQDWVKNCAVWESKDPTPQPAAVAVLDALGESE